MTRISSAQLEDDLQTYLAGVLTSEEPLVVALPGGKGNVVLLSENDFESWRETIHLLGEPAHAAQLMRSIQQADEGRFAEYDRDAVLKQLP